MPPRSHSALAGLEESWGLGLAAFPPGEKGIGPAAPILGVLEPGGAVHIPAQLRGVLPLLGGAGARAEVEGSAQPRSCLLHGWAGDCSLFYISFILALF